MRKDEPRRKVKGHGRDVIGTWNFSSHETLDMLLHSVLFEIIITFFPSFEFIYINYLQVATESLKKNLVQKTKYIHKLFNNAWSKCFIYLEINMKNDFGKFLKNWKI